MRKHRVRAARVRFSSGRCAGTRRGDNQANCNGYASVSMSASSYFFEGDASEGHSSEGDGSEGHASACPQSEAEDAQKHVPPDQGMRKHVPERRHPIHLAPLEAHNRPIIIFVTTCTAKRHRILASASARDAFVGAWYAASTWLVGRYVIMPDHVHFFCAPNDVDAPSLERWMRFWKSLVTRS